MKRRLVSHWVQSQRKQQEVIKQLQERYEYTNLKDPKAFKDPNGFETSVVVSTNVRITDDVELYYE